MFAEKLLPTASHEQHATVANTPPRIYLHAKTVSDGSERQRQGSSVGRVTGYQAEGGTRRW